MKFMSLQMPGPDQEQRIAQLIRAGASLVQLYTAFAYQGPGMLPRMKRELLECLDRDGFASVREAVGADHRARRSARKSDRDEAP